MAYPSSPRGGPGVWTSRRIPPHDRLSRRRHRLSVGRRISHVRCRRRRIRLPASSGRLRPVLGPDDPRRPWSFGVLSRRAPRTLCLTPCQATTPPPRWSGRSVASPSPWWGYPDGVPNGSCGLAGCAISLPDPNRAAPRRGNRQRRLTYPPATRHVGEPKQPAHPMTRATTPRRFAADQGVRCRSWSVGGNSPHYRMGGRLAPARPLPCSDYFHTSVVAEPSDA